MTTLIARDLVESPASREFIPGPDMFGGHQRPFIWRRMIAKLTHNRHFKALFALLIAPGVLPAQEYFPPGILDKNPQFDELKRNWYSKHLKALREPSLWELSRRDPKAESYRFLWLRSFNRPIAVRLVVRTNGSGWINSRMTTGQGGFKPGRIGRYGVSWLRKRKTQAFLTALEGANFWNLPALPDADENEVGLDGAHWVIEGVRNGTYHIVDRWSPEAGDAVRVIGIMALKLGRFKIHSTEVY